MMNCDEVSKAVLRPEVENMALVLDFERPVTAWFNVGVFDGLHVVELMYALSRA